MPKGYKTSRRGYGKGRAIRTKSRREYSIRRGKSSRRGKMFKNRGKRRLRKTIKKVIRNSAETLVWYGVESKKDINPYRTQNHTPFYPSDAGGLGTDNYGSFEPRFTAGDQPEQKDDSENWNGITETGGGPQISGNEVFLKGFRVQVAISENDFGSTERQKMLWRFVMKHAYDPEVDEVMTPTNWEDLQRYEDTGSNVRDILMSWQDKDFNKKYKTVIDTKWKKVGVRQTPPALDNDQADTTTGDLAWEVDTRVYKFYIPYNKKFRINTNGNLIGFRKLNWAVMCSTNDYSFSPDVNFRIDMYYQD